MNAFEFFCLGRIIFGRQTVNRVGELSAALGKRALVVTNAGQPGDGGVLDRLAALLSAAGVATSCTPQRGEPSVADVEQSLQIAKSADCDLVIGLGGGSAIDAAKAVAGLLTNPGSPLDYMEVVGKGQPLRQPAAPWIAVPTTAGTGAEATRNAVIGCPEKKFKASLRSEHLLAKIAVIDPELAVTAPPEVTAASGLDALCQLIESYTSNRAQGLTDALALQGVSLAATALPRVCADGTDLDARESMALAALLSGITLANAGLGAVHGFAAPLGANFPIPHGTVCAALLPHVVAANMAALAAELVQHPYLERYAELGRRLTHRPSLGRDEALDACRRFLFDLVHQLRIPPLRSFGLRPAHVPDMVALARKASSMRYNPIPLTDESLTQILTAAAGL
jgi:alcohol dehydrogenase class IV